MGSDIDNLMDRKFDRLSDDMSVIDLRTRVVVATVPLESGPIDLAVSRRVFEWLESSTPSDFLYDKYLERFPSSYRSAVVIEKWEMYISREIAQHIARGVWSTHIEAQENNKR